MEIRVGKYEILVDDADADIVGKHKWRVFDNKKSHIQYAMTRIHCKCCKRQATVFMHRMLLGLDPGSRTVVDHKNHNGLDNRRDNLRACASWQNAHYKRMRKGVEKYSSQYRGVRWMERYRLWEASIKVQ